MRKHWVALTTLFGVFALAVGLGIHLYMQSDAYCRKDKTCEGLSKLEGAIGQYVIETGDLPPDLSTLLTSSRDWKPRPWLAASGVFDQWGHPIEYVHPIEQCIYSFRLTVHAADEQPDGNGPSHNVVREWKC